MSHMHWTHRRERPRGAHVRAGIIWKRCARALRQRDRQGGHAIGGADVQGAGRVLGGHARPASTRTPAPCRATGRPAGVIADCRHPRPGLDLQGLRRRGPRVRRRRRHCTRHPRLSRRLSRRQRSGRLGLRRPDLHALRSRELRHVRRGPSRGVHRPRRGARVRCLPARVRRTTGTCAAGVECASGADCPAGYSCLDNGSGTTRYCVGPACSDDGECSGGAVCQQYCTFDGCGPRRCVCPGFGCGEAEVCIDDGGLACRELCTEDADCPGPVGVCVNSTFGSGLCINSTPCH